MTLPPIGHGRLSAPDNYGRNPDYCGFGWTGCLGSLDFAGGTVIHITSGWSGLVIALMLGRRLGYGKLPMEPHNISLVVLGAALLWVGWFGFNAGSAGAAASNASSAFVATQIATGMAAVTWALVSWAHTGRPSTVGAASGAVAGLVAITPGIWICVTNVRANHRHFSRNCLLCSSYVQE